jgi:hypothetical protein
LSDFDVEDEEKLQAIKEDMEEDIMSSKKPAVCT